MLVDIDEGRIAFAKEMGFENAWNSKDGDPVRWISKITGDRGADLAVEGAGVSSALEQCTQALTMMRDRSKFFNKVIFMNE